MNPDDIKKIINDPNRENLTIDFKKSDVLKDEGLNKLLMHIVSFANRKGGRILIGINDDGTFEGKDIFDVKINKEALNNKIRDKIRPILNCDIEFVSCTKGDVLVISIPKFKEVPHAVVKLKNGDIESRKYYIRTPDGKKFVSDRQLQYLFRNEVLDFLYLFKFTLKLNIENLGVIDSFDNLPCLGYFEEFIYDLPKEDIKIIKEKEFNQFSDVFPYLMLCTLSKYFRRSWAIKLISDNNFIFKSTVPLIKYEHLLIPLPSNESKLNLITIDIRDYLKGSRLFHDFYIPPNVNISIDKSLLQLKHEDFIFKIAVQSTGYSHTGGQDYIILTFNCFYEVKFNFPETNFELYEEYHQLALSIKEIIKRNWDYESYLEKNQYKLLNSINEKLDKLLTS